jgi:hypothetical protein
LRPIYCNNDVHKKREREREREGETGRQTDRQMAKSIGEVGVEDLVKAGLTTEEAHEFQRVLKEAVSGAKESDPREVWRQLVARRVLKPWHPHGLHQLLYHSVYANWDPATNGPPPYWFPSLYDFCFSPVYIYILLFHCSLNC